MGAWQTSSTSLPANLSLSTSYPSVQCGVYSGYLFCEDIFKGLNSYPYLQVWSAPINPNGMLGAFTVAYSGILPSGSTAPDGCFTTAEGYMYCFEIGTPPNGAYEMIIDLSTSGSATQASQNFTQWYPIELYGDVTLYCATHNYGDYVMYCTGGSFGTTNVYGLKTNGGKLVPLITNASYPIAVGGAACNVLNGYIYCVGDINASAPAYMQAIYSDSTNGDTLNSWGPPEENNYPIPTADMGCTIFNSNWYCVGGNGWNTQNDESYFAPLTTGGVGTWNQVTTFPESIFFNYVFAVTASTTTSTSTTSTTVTTTVTSSCSIYGSSRVLLANGTYIAASQLKPGMAIMSYNPASNITQPSIISDILKGHALNRYIFNNNLTVDSQETMLINGRWMLAGNSKVGDMVYDPLTKHNVPITSINISYNGGTVYDIYDQPINNFITYGGYVVDLVTSSTKSGCSVVGYDAIELANGSYVPASEIKVGQSLMSYNLKNKSAAPTVVTGIKSFNVTQTYIINNNLTIDASETLLVNGNFTTAANLKIGDYLFSPLSGKNVKVTSLNIVNSTSRVYDINTAPIDAYIANGYMIT